MRIIILRNVLNFTAGKYSRNKNTKLRKVHILKSRIALAFSDLVTLTLLMIWKMFKSIIVVVEFAFLRKYFIALSNVEVS